MGLFLKKVEQSDQRTKRVIQWGALAVTLCSLLGFVFLRPAFLHAQQGLFIPSTTTINVNTGTICSNDDIRVEGTLTSTTGWVRMHGDWINAVGTYTPNMGTLDFKGTGTQTLISSGTNSGKLFYNLSHTGTGTVNVSSNDLNIDNNFSNTNGTFNLGTQNITIEGNWTNTAAFNPGTSTVLFDGTAQQVLGSTTFNNFTKTVVVADTMVFDSTGTQAITGTLRMHGTLGNLLTITSTDTNQWGINLRPGGFQMLNSLQVQRSDAGPGLTLHAGINSVDLGSNNNWVFGGGTLVWDGDTDTDWDEPSNWDLGFVPTAIDNVVIPGAPVNQPVLNLAVQITDVEIQSGGMITLDGFNIDITGTLSNEGTINLFGSETVMIANPDTDSGTFVFLGDGNGSADTHTIPELGTTDYFNVVINDANATMDRFDTTGTLTVNGSLTITSSELDISANADTLITTGTLFVNGGVLTSTLGNLDANGSVVLTSGTLTAPNNTGTFSIAGDFNHNTGGVFTNSGGIVNFDGTDQGILGDQNNTFNTLRKVTAAADSFTFTTGATQTITGTLVLQGAVGNILSIDSDTAGVQADIELLPGGLQYLDYLDVRDNDASAGGGVGLLLVPRNSTEVFGNTTNWNFTGADITWQGDVSSDWYNPANWDLGVVPSANDHAIIPPVAGFDPIVTAAVMITELTLNPGGASLDLEGFNFDVSGTLSNEGTISLFGNQTYDFGIPDADSGLFIFEGDGDGLGETFVIPELGATDFFNVIINDANATMDTFQTTGSFTIGGTLTLTSSTFDISTMMTDLGIGGTLQINGGQILAMSGTIDIDGGVVITSGTLSAPGDGQSFTIANDWSIAVGGTFINNGGDVEFDSLTNTTITGASRFDDLFSSQAGKLIIFESGVTQTVEGSMVLTGASGNELTIRPSVAATQFFIDFTSGAQISQFVDVDYSTAVTNPMTCFNCIENTASSTVNWIFGVLAITVPVDGVVTDTTPTIIGVAAAGVTVDIRDGANMIIGSTVADANGNFRFEVSGTLAPGPITMTPYIGAAFGGTINVTISAAPTTVQQPTIDSPIDGARIIGATPTITGMGAPNSAITIVANDTNGNLLLTTVATGTVAADGTYSIELTTPLPKSTNYVSVTVNGVASDIFTYMLTDPYGVVFNSISNEPIPNASVLLVINSTGLPGVPGVDLAATDVNPVVTGTNGVYAFLTVNNDYRLEVSADSYDFPSLLDTFDAGRAITVGSKGEVFTVAGTVLEIDLPMDPSADLLRIEKDANKAEARIGDVVTYTITIENTGIIDAVDTRIHDKIPAGFKYIKNRVTLDGVPIAEPEGNRPLIFDVGTIAVGETKTLKYQLVIGSGVVIGDYQNVAIARHISGLQLSNVATEQVTVILDPLFDLGTTIGKVFYDRNENGVQDPPVYDPVQDKLITEEPVPNVRIVMEDGTIVTTDKEGRYNVPALVPGRHLFRLDERTLPDGTYLTTDKVVVVDVTPGLLIKANFGIKEDEDIVTTADSEFFAKKIKVVTDDAKPIPRLHVDIFEDPVAVFNGVFLRKVEFRIFSNYVAFVKRWQLEIIDKDVGKVIKRIEGNRLNMYDPIFWDGRDERGQHIDPKKNYEYRLMIEDDKGKFDETAARPLTFRMIEDELQLQTYELEIEEKRKRYQTWVEKQLKENSLKIQTILVDGRTIKIDRLGTRLKSVRVMEKGQLLTEVPIIERHGLTAQEIIEGIDVEDIGRQQQLEVILPKGNYSLVVQEDQKRDTAPLESVRVVEGYGEIREEYSRPVQTYSKPLQVGEDELFFVAMGDGRVGYTFTRGNVEPVQQDDRFTEGFYSEGKLAYYLKGKILGKYLVTSSFDTQRERKEIFRDLDPEEYYPIYGDGSQINYDATNTQGNLYALVEWDKSSVIWGNYSVGFEDTEFARFSRSLYGGKIDFESLSANKYGDARTKVIAFKAKAQQRSAHNEFLATGGSLYFLKHTDVLQGSDKVTIEIRDKINGLVLTSREMVEGADYELDYSSGRLVFWKPVPALVQAYSIIEDDLLGGNLVYVVADYEYKVKDKVDEGAVGVRARQAIGDNVLVGTTYVREGLEQDDYQLRGTDVTVKVGEDASITAEYAATSSESQPSYISTDGGLSFTELQTSEGSRGRAYGLKGNARLFNRLGVNAYYKWIDNEFSSSATTAQQGKELLGGELIYDLGENTRFTLRQDVQRLIDDGNLQTQLQVGSNRTSTTLAQIVHEARDFRVTAEYRRNVDEAADEAVDIVAIRGEYKFNERLIFALTQQATIGEDDWRTTVGIAAKPNDKLTITIQEVFSQDGTATTIGLIADMNERFALTAGYTLEDSGGKQATIGAIAKLNEAIQLETSFGISSTEGFTRAFALGASGQRKFGDSTLDTTFDTDESGNTKASAKFGGTAQLTEQTELSGQVEASGTTDSRTGKVTLGQKTQVTDTTEVSSSVEMTGGTDSRMTNVRLGGVTQFDEDTMLESEVKLSEATSGYRASTLSIGGRKRVDDRTQVENKISFTESNTGDDETSVSFGTTKKLTNDIELTTARIFGTSGSSETNESKYGLSLVRDGKKLEGTLSRRYAAGETEISRSNIFGLTGELDDRWAISGKYERSEVDNLDGSSTKRDVISFAGGYVKKDPDTGLEVFKSSTKVEVRFDDATTDTRQYLVSNSTEGQLTPEFSLYTRAEVSETFDTSLDTQIAQHKEFVIGGAYRPIMFDTLNVLGRYTYLEGSGPDGQEDESNIEEEKAHVISAEAVYDITNKWQITEKFAYRIGDEKVEGFDFTETHTWLMIHRLTYKINKDWSLSGEYRMLTQREAEDKKQGLVFEASRRVGEYAQLGVGYDFTDFTDDLTDLDYTTYGPFVRVTGKFYDRSAEEIERARQKWLNEKIDRWAWIMVREELEKPSSPILRELNDYFVMAQLAYKKGDYEESKRIYKDIIMAGKMMHGEAAEFIRLHVEKEDRLREMKELADQYYKNGQYEKAKKILEKILEEAQKPVVR